MTFRSLALKNIRVNWRSYSAFFFSSLFSVAIFYIYYAFMVHPDVVNGQMAAASKVTKGMEFCLYLISIFSVIFILYSSSSFLKSRKKEFGLFSLFGMTRRQLRKLVFIENMLIGLLSTMSGIGVGILFSKLFLMGLGTLLELEQHIRFAVPVKALVVTIILFLAMFLVITLYTTMRMGKGQIIELLQAHKQPKGELKYSAWKVVIGTISLLLGYALAVTMTIGTFLVVALPIIGFVVLGTFLLYSQLSVVTLNLLKRRKSLFYNKSNMLIISQLGYKIKDNARILFTITILSAVVMTAMGTIYVMQNMGKQEMKKTPYALAWIESEHTESFQLDRNEIDDLIKQYGLHVSEEGQLEGYQFENYHFALQPNGREYSGYSDFIMLISQSAYNEQASKGKKMELGADEAALLFTYYDGNPPQQGTIKGNVGEAELELPIVEVRVEEIMNNILDWNYYTVIVSDQRYEQITSQVDESNRFTIHGIDFTDMKKSAEMLQEYSERYSSDIRDTVEFSRDIRYFEFVQYTSLTIFIGIFICFLFFIAAGSLIYFKLFTERDEDIAMFQGLSRIGITFKEMKRVIVTQIGIVFFLPCAVGIIHAFFAMIALDNLLMTPGWLYSLIVFAIYVVMQAIYFFIASSSYLHSIRKGTSVA